MSTNKYLYLFRYPAGGPPKPSSPEEMQAMYAAWGAWKTRFADELTPGDGLAGGAVVKGTTVTDGPYIEAKEVIASYATVQTTSLARAVEIAKECPIHAAGGSIEIRELAGY